MKYQWLVIVLVCVAGVASAQTETKLTASDGAASDRFGYAVALSGDTAVVGAYMDDDDGSSSGSASVFIRNPDGSWSQQAKLTASDAAASDNFGRAVAIDGDTALIGALLDNSSAGSAYVFVRSGVTWTQQAKLTASDGLTMDYFGCAVSVDGDTALIGAHGDDPLGGSAYIFTRYGSTWTQQAKLTASDAGSSGVFGYSVSLDQDTALIGAYSNDVGGISTGAAYVFTGSGSTWTEQAKLAASDGAADDRFGWSVSVSGDTAAVGATYDDDANSASGSAYVFTRSGVTWTEVQKLTASDAASGDSFGYSVSLDGSTLLIGAPYKRVGVPSAGVAYIFREDGDGSWYQQARLNASDVGGADFYGWSSSLSGSTALMGAYGADGAEAGSGAAYVSAFCGETLVLIDGQWKLISLPCALSASVSDLFGGYGLGTYGTDWSVFERDEDNDVYRELLLTDTIAQGTGYWVIVVGSSPVIDVYGDPTDTSGDFEVALVDTADPGRWNLVGHPFTFDVSWGDVKVKDSSTSAEYALSTTTAGNYITNRTMYKWNGSSYQSYHPVSFPGSLSTFDGFWVRVKAGASLLIPPSAAKKAAAGDLSTGGWWIQLVASADGYTDPGNRLGRLSVATDSLDEYDLEEREPFASPYLTLVFPHPEWSTDAWSYTTDYRQDRTGAGGLWHFELQSDTPRVATLQWQGEGSQYEALLQRSLLTDVESDITFSPAAQPSYLFSMAAGTHRFSWFVNSLPSLEAGPDRTAVVGRELAVVMPFRDEDVEDTHAVTICWGDGPTEVGLVDPATRTVSGTHSYSVSGVYTVEICIEDSFPSQSCDSLQVEALEWEIFSDGFETGDTTEWTSAQQR